MAISIGIKTNRSERIGKLNGKEFKRCYRVWFTTDIHVFKLPRKLQRIRKTADKSKRRYITDVVEVESKPVRCIRVSNPSHLYLTGEGCIPTHNTFAASSAISLAFPLKQQALWRWVAPIYTQSKVGYKYCKRILPPEPYVRPNESNLSLSIPSLDSQIQFFHGQHPESLEGEATHGNVLDECAKMKEGVYESAKTTTTVTRGPILGISTPKGKNNWFYKKCMEAKEEMIRAKHEGRRPTKIFIHAPTWTNPSVSMDIIEDAKRTMPDRLWRQYFMADFISEGSVFTNVSSCYTTDYLDLSDQFVWLEPNSKEKDVVVGVDWARNIDYTVFTASEVKTRKLVGMQRIREASYPSQVQRLKAFCDRFQNVRTVWHDKTGVGVALDDMLSGTDLPYRGITFSNASKNELMVKLMLGFEQETYGVPQINAITNELTDIEVKSTLTGLPTYSAPDGAHDDIVMSMALSHAAMLEHQERSYEILSF